MHERGDDGVTPLRELRDVRLGEAEDARHHTLWQRPGELADELDLGVVDPLVEQLVRVTGDHLAVAQRSGSDPWIGEFLAVAVVELLRRTQRQHRRLHQVVVG